MPFITFEGMEGCGKSTQAKLLARALGSDAVLTQEPGGTAIGRAIRQLLLDPANRAMSAEAEVLLFFDLPLEIGLARVVRRGGRDRLESEVREFHERVRNGYLELAAAEPDRWIRIDASGSEADVEARTRAAVEARGLAPSHGVR